MNAQVFVLALLLIPLTLVFMNKLREDVAALLIASSLGMAQVFGLPVLGEGHDAVVVGFGAAHHSLAPPIVLYTL